MPQHVQNTIQFLRMTAIQMRPLAESAPDVVTQFRHMAAQCDAEADDLESQNVRNA